jgi:hypothetical protein
MRISLALGALLIIAVCLIRSNNPQERWLAVADFVRLPQGLSKSEVQSLYSTYEGSQLMPYTWFKAIELSGSQKKLLDNYSAYGLVKEAGELPIGFTTVDDPETGKLYGENRWVGVNCSTCHTGVLQIKGQNVVIEGGAALFDLQKFEKDLIAGIQDTLKDPRKFTRFAESLNNQDQNTLRKYVEQFSQEFSGWVSRNHIFYDQKGQSVAFGPGRVDGIGGATNDLICQYTHRLGDTAMAKQVSVLKNCQTAHAGVSLPHLWGMTDQDWVQWAGNVHSSLGRNIGQATATYGKNWIEKNEEGEPIYRSTANLDGVYELERLYDKLKPPLWNDLVKLRIAEPLDLEKIRQGRIVFKNACQNCHSVQPDTTWINYFGNSYWKTKVFPVQEIGTDPVAVMANVNRKAVLPAVHYQEYTENNGIESVGKNSLVSAADYRAFIIGKIIFQLFDRKDSTYLEMAGYANCRDSSLKQSIIGYKARSLEGVVFTAPYLHNGSVANLGDLLKPASQRPKTFYLGCRKYDLTKLGYDCDKASENSFLFDTALEGNSNEGHEYGTTLSEEQKASLIEFLKSLNSPQRPLKNPICN